MNKIQKRIIGRMILALALSSAGIAVVAWDDWRIAIGMVVFAWGERITISTNDELKREKARDKVEYW